MNFRFTPLAIPDVVLIEPRAFPDERGYFMESYKESAFREGGLGVRFVQDNRSLSKRGVVRGLHYQRPPHAQGKLVSVVEGEIFDVAVDLRPGSETFGSWLGERLSAENRRILWIPEGFAHGFQALSETAHVCYKTTSEYAREADAGVRWNDPEIGVEWPLSPAILSAKDESLPGLAQVRLDFAELDAR
ncbi:MAG TPA: dTDP-4-dehydrorhamnose 3,5-epimerase [Trueperaceae bacterium]